MKIYFYHHDITIKKIYKKNNRFNADILYEPLTEPLTFQVGDSLSVSHMIKVSFFTLLIAAIFRKSIDVEKIEPKKHLFKQI